VRYDVEILLLLRRIIRAVDVYSRMLTSRYEITAPQLVCLLAVVESPPTTATKIAEQIHLSPSTVVGVLDRLEHRGLVARERDTADRRVVNVTPTKKGVKVAAKAPSPLQESLDSALRRLPEGEQETIARSLRRIVDLMEQSDVDPALVIHSEDVSEDNPRRK
jgi:DNA-binding MarR family transcriptional regulator